MIHSKIVPNNNKKNVVEIFIKELLLRLFQDIIRENISVRSTHEIRINMRYYLTNVKSHFWHFFEILFIKKDTEKAKIFFEEIFENTSYVISPIVKFGTRDFFSELQSFVKSFSIHKIDRFTTHTDKMKRKV